jgi:hypothetical protein
MERGVLTTPTASHHPDSTPYSGSVWPRPGKEPLLDVDRAALVAIHHQAAVRTAIHAYPKWHALLTLADMPHPGRIAFVLKIEFFPKAQTLVDQHLHKAVEPPIIIHQAVAYPSLVSLLTSFLLVFLDDHLQLGKIANDRERLEPAASRAISMAAVRRTLA